MAPAKPLSAGPTTAPGEACPSWVHEDNVFSTRRRMDWAHRPIVVLAARTLEGCAGSVLDLGCGNGALLRKIHAHALRTTPFGIDREADRIEHARALLPRFATNFVAGDLFDPSILPASPERFALAVLTPRRLLEAGPEKSAALLDRLRPRCDRLLIYAYGTGLTQFGDLVGFARAAGILLDAGEATARAAIARRF